MGNNTTEEDLLKNGWKRECLQIHIAEFDKNLEYGSRRLTYDLGTDFNSEQIGSLQHFAQEVNNRFPKIKVSLSGTGFIKEDQENITE